jgi:hypothetical protein
MGEVVNSVTLCDCFMFTVKMFKISISSMTFERNENQRPDLLIEEQSGTKGQHYFICCYIYISGIVK